MQAEEFMHSQFDSFASFFDEAMKTINVSEEEHQQILLPFGHE